MSSRPRSPRPRRTAVQLPRRARGYLPMPGAATHTASACLDQLVGPELADVVEDVAAGLGVDLDAWLIRALVTTARADCRDGLVLIRLERFAEQLLAARDDWHVTEAGRAVLADAALLEQRKAASAGGRR